MRAANGDKNSDSGVGKGQKKENDGSMSFGASLDIGKGNYDGW